MLDKQSEKVLKIAASKYNGNSDIDIPIYPNEINIHYSELNALCFNLHEEGYVQDFYATNDTHYPAKLRLTYRGLHYFKYKDIENRVTFKKSIFIPIIVTLSTQAVVFLLKLLLPLILQWLSHIL